MMPAATFVGAVETGGRHRGDAVDELDLAHGLHLFRPVGAVHGAAFDEDRGDDVVPGPQVLLDLVHQVAPLDPPLAVIPEVMVRVADRQVGLDRRFPDLRQPCVVRRHDPVPSSVRAQRGAAFRLASPLPPDPKPAAQTRMAARDGAAILRLMPLPA